MKMVYAAMLLLIVGVSADAAPDISTSKTDQAFSSQEWRYEAKEHYRFNLGGDSGQYTDWERLDLDGFDGIAATVQIDKVYGKPTDKWGSIARIAMFGTGTEKERPMFSLMFYVDRKTNTVVPIITHGKNAKEEAFDLKFEVGKPIEFTILPTSPGKLLFGFGKQTFEVPYDFEIKALKVVGSGVDVKFEPFNLLRRVQSR
ncbi:hypothetical protein [Rudaea sp.]|uniref:hypothetical protein n=1 Tax=Rudaea sp. TaxID=2136325 RepID=UPI002ED2B4A5